MTNPYFAGISTDDLIAELVIRGWKKYGAEDRWTHQRVVELRESVALGDLVLVAPARDPTSLTNSG